MSLPQKPDFPKGYAEWLEQFNAWLLQYEDFLQRQKAETQSEGSNPPPPPPPKPPGG